MLSANLSSILILCLGALLLSAGIEDIHRREIANWKNAAVALMAPVWWWTSGLSLWPGVPVQLLLAAVVFAMFCGAFAAGMMGGGDVKLIAALALWLPLEPLLDMLMVMAIAGGAVTLAIMIDHRIRRSEGPPEVPYGVAIAAAGLLALGEPILNHFPR